MAQASEIASLREVFPNLSPSTIQDIYNARGGNFQAALDTLLMISGPQNQVPPPPPPPRPQSSNYNAPSPATSPYLAPAQQPPYQSPGQNYLQPPPVMMAPNSTTSPQHSPSPQPQHYQQTGHAQSYFTGVVQQQQPHSLSPSACSPQPSSPRPAYSPQPSPQPSPGLYPQQQPPSYQSNGSSMSPYSSPSMPDMSKLSLTPSYQQLPPPQNTRNKHVAQCDGCGAYPIRGVRWKCMKCPDEDLCNSCMEAGVQSSHRFERIESVKETHENYCDGCAIPSRAIVGTRYACQTHADEDFCEACVREGRACKGPFKEVKMSPLGLHLEQYGCVPMPNEWAPLLQPETGEYHYGSSDVSDSWRGCPTKLGLVQPSRREWVNDTPPASEYEIAVSKHSSKFAWKMTHVATKKLVWTFKAKINHKHLLEEGSLTPGHGHAIALNWQRTSRSDMLQFTSNTGTKLRWATSAPVSNINGNRFDLVRYALFAGVSGQQSREAIIADYTEWDGDLEAPCERLTLRSKQVDQSLILASFLAVVSYGIFDQDAEIRQYPAAVDETEMVARTMELGRQSFWYLSDFGDSSAAASNGSSGMSSSEKLKMLNGGLKVLNGGLKVAAAVMGAQGGG